MLKGYNGFSNPVTRARDRELGRRVSSDGGTLLQTISAPAILVEGAS